MPSPFDITTASSSVTLDNNRQGIAVFTVKNNVQRRIHAQARLSTQPATALAWLTILPADPTSSDPANMRDLPVGSTQQIQVKIAVPADAPAGSYTLKLMLADEVNPDDNFSESPDVAFAVHDVPKPTPPQFPTWIIPAVLIGVAVIAIIIIAGVALSHRQGGACVFKMKASQFVYTEPDTIANNMLDQFQAGRSPVTATAKSADDKWLAFPFETSNILGWIQKDLLATTADVSGDCTNLPVVCLLEITSDQDTFTKPVLDPNNQWTRLTAGYQVVPVGKSPDGNWWKLSMSPGLWIPASAVGTTGKTSGDCSKLPTVTT